MHDTAYLHIRSRDGRATRVVALSGPSARVGRGRSCEVQLDEPSLAEVECILRRRGDSWHLQPVQPTARLTVDGRPADRPRPLPMGTTLRLADRWLTLLPTDDAPDLDLDFGPPAGDDLPTEGPPPAPEAVGVEEADSLDGRREELARWEARLKHREQWLTDRLHERQWEARWRAAGASLKTRGRAAGDPAPRPRPTPRPPASSPTVPEPATRYRRDLASTTVEPPELRAPYPVSNDPPRPNPRPVPPSIGRLTPTSTAPRPPGEPSADSRSLRLAVEVISVQPDPPSIPASERGIVETVIEIEEEPVEPGSQDRPTLASGVETASEQPSGGPAGFEVPDNSGVVPGEPAEAGVEPDAEAPRIPVAILPGEPDIEIQEDGPPGPGAEAPEGPPTGPEAAKPSGSTDLVHRADSREAPQPETEEGEPVEGSPRFAGGEAAGWLSVPMLGLNDLVSFLSRSPGGDPASAPEPGPEPIARPGGPIPDRGPVDQSSPVAISPPPASIPDPVPDDERAGEAVEDEGGLGTAPESSREPDPPVGASDRAAGEWPSARAILGARPDPDRGRRGPRPRRPLSFPEPTDRVSPDEWAIPGGAWLCIPMMFAALAVGVAGVRVAWTWALLDRESGRIADRLASGKRPEAGSLELLLERELELPMASWRTSTADAMIARAALLSGPGPGFDPAAQERAGGLIHAAGASSPGHPGLRFARAWRAVQEPGADPPSMAVGLSRDIWPLAWSARALLSAGKADEARRAYLKAMDLACRAAPDGSAPPRFHADPQGGHFGLPLEGVIGVIVADMADRPEWSSEDWLELIPESSLAWLVAARVLRQRGDEAADRALERAIALADEPTPPGCSAAIHLAAGAEAMALDGRLEEAAGRYREAISRLSQAEEPARRPWMFNLADLLGRLDDRQGEREALLAAMITDPDDPVTAEAIRSQLRRGVDLVGAVGGEGEDRETFGE